MQKTGMTIAFKLCLLSFIIMSLIDAQTASDTWFILNKDNQYPAGVYVPCPLQVANNLIALGGIHIGGTSDPGTDNLIVDGKIAIGKTTAWSDLDVDGDINCTKLVIGQSSGSSSWDLYVHGQAFLGDELKVDDDIYALGGIHVGGTWSPGTDNLIVDGKVGIGTNSPYERLHVDGRVYIYDMNGTSSGSVVRWYNNRLCYETSSRRFKGDIQLFIADFIKILELAPSCYIDKLSGAKEIGYLAETFDSLGLFDLVIYRDEIPDGIKYERISVYLVEILKMQAKKLEIMKQENNDLEERIARLEKIVRG